MNELSSVNKIKSLTQQIESVTGKSHSNLTVAIQALKDGYESDSGSSGIIDVTELPRENIDENAVYRVTETIQTEKTEAYRVYSGYVTSLSDIMASMDIPASNMHVYVVDELPTDMKSSDVETFTELHIYLLRTDGKGYMHISGHGVVTLATMFFQDPSYDKGFTENVYAEAEDGIYTTLESYKQIESYFVRENGEWKEITAFINTSSPHGFTDIEFLSGSYNLEELVITQEDNFKAIDVLEKIRNDRIIPTSIKINCFDIAKYIGTTTSVDVDETWFRDEYGELSTQLRDGAFAFTYLNNVVLPDTIECLPRNCFENSYISGDVILPKSLKRIKCQAFNCVQWLRHIQIPDSVEYIEDYAFNQCSLIDVVLSKSLKEISSFAFSHSYDLTTVTFQSTPTIGVVYQSTNVFQSCDSLTTINVPWSEGEVEGAPWGATNATINYNYTGE